MPKYQATYGLNVRRYIKHDIEADTPEEAIEKARSAAEELIEAELIRFQNRDGFADTAPIDAAFMLDRMSEDGWIEEEIHTESLPNLD